MKQVLLLSALIPKASSFMPLFRRAHASTQKMSKTLSFAAFSSSSTEAVLNTIFGGDYAGRSATFSSIDGKIIPVPEHFVPDSMVEWGQVPNSFECIVSEDIVQDQDDDSKDVLVRNVVNVMPEVGCGLDNLDTILDKDSTAMESFRTFTFEEDDVQVATSFSKEDKNRVECVFTMKKNNGNVKDDKDTMTEVERMRVLINLHENNQLRSPIKIFKERKTSCESTSGTIAKGGGLHSSTVASLIGKENFNKPFCDGEAMDLSELEGTWKSSDAEFNRDAVFWSSEESTSFAMPGNILIRNCESPRSLEICLLLKSESDSLKRIGVNYLIRETSSEVECFEEAKL